MVRTAYALGGMGSGFASNEQELAALVKSPLASGSQVSSKLVHLTILVS